jgi:hypothetical protein
VQDREKKGKTRMTSTDTYRSLYPQAYDDGFAYGNATEPKIRFAEGYTGAVIATAEEIEAGSPYDAYNEGYCAGLRARWLRDRNEGESLLGFIRRTTGSS